MYPNRSTFLSSVENSLWYEFRPSGSSVTTVAQTNGFSLLRDLQAALNDAALNGMFDGPVPQGSVARTPAYVPALPADVTGWTPELLRRMEALAKAYGFETRDPAGMRALLAERPGKRLSDFTSRLALWLAYHQRALREDQGDDAGFLYNLGDPSELRLPPDTLRPKLGDTLHTPGVDPSYGTLALPASAWRQKNAEDTKDRAAFYVSLAVLAGVLGGAALASRG